MSKHLRVENELDELKKFDLYYSTRKTPFGEDGMQNYLVFQPINKYFKASPGVGNDSYIYYWNSKALSDERINSIKAPNHSITPNASYYGT